MRVNLADAWQYDPILFVANNRLNRSTGDYIYQNQFYRSKFCICPAGSQVNSARIAESIHYGCVPGKSHFEWYIRTHNAVYVEEITN